MATPSKALIKKERKRVDLLKGRFEHSLKATFHKWQVKVHAEFMSQIKRGASIPILSPELKASLTALLITHYHEVAEAFVPGLEFPPEQKQSTIGDPVGSEEEDDDALLFDWLLPSIFANILKGLNAQVSLNLPIHQQAILNTTHLMGVQSVLIARREEADVAVILGNKFASRETTVAITETDWIAEASTNTALEVTTPEIAIANEAQMKEIQKISPNTTLKETDLTAAFATPIFIGALKRELSIPQKMWVTMGDKRVRPTHRAVNLVQAAATEPFILPGGLLMFPSDSSLGVAFREIVNCRCFALYF